MNLVAISDRAKAVLSIEQERMRLWHESSDISQKQMAVIVEFSQKMLDFSRSQSLILGQMTALDALEEKLVQK